MCGVFAMVWPQSLRRGRSVAAGVAIDSVDLRILEVVQAEGRITNEALARRISLSPSACLARLRRLERDALITGYAAQVAIERIRPTVIVMAEVTLTRHHPSDFAAFGAFARQIRQIAEALEVSGAYDFLLKVVVSDLMEWRALADQILTSELGVEKIATHVVMHATKPFLGYDVKSA